MKTVTFTDIEIGLIKESIKSIYNDCDKYASQNKRDPGTHTQEDQELYIRGVYTSESILKKLE